MYAQKLTPSARRAWPRGVTVSTLDSESSDRSSNPREASLFSSATLRKDAATSLQQTEVSQLRECLGLL